MAITVQVALDTTANPQVIVIPFVPIVSRHEEIIWTRIANEVFTFDSLTAKKSTLHNIKRSPTEITATYDAKAKDQCNYTIVVRDAHGDPHDTITRGGITTGGGPTIKNN